MNREQLIEAHDLGLWADVVHTRWRIEHHCVVCRRLTPLVEVNFEAPLCSDQCVNAEWARYVDALETGARVLVS